MALQSQKHGNNEKKLRKSTDFIIHSCSKARAKLTAGLFIAIRTKRSTSASENVKAIVDIVFNAEVIFLATS